MYARARARTHTHTHTHTKRGKGKTDYSVAGEGVTKRGASGPFSTFCHHVVTKHGRVTKRAGSASNLTRFVILVTKRAVVTKRAATEVLRRCPLAIAQRLVHCTLAVSTVVLGQSHNSKTMSVALLLRNNPKRKKSNCRSPAPPPCS